MDAEQVGLDALETAALERLTLGELELIRDDLKMRCPWLADAQRETREQAIEAIEAQI